MIPPASSVHSLTARLSFAALAVFALAGCSSSAPPSNPDSSKPSTRQHKRPTPKMPPGVQRLGDAPLCEASAALRAPWDSKRVLVADNEVQGALFGFLSTPKGLVNQTRYKIKGKDDPDDMEALADAGHQQVLVVGSHSRSSSCKARPERQRLKWVSWDAKKNRLRTERLIETEKTVKSAMRGTSECVETLFVQPPPKGAKELCSALVRAHEKRSKKSCETLDIEGAVGVPTKASSTRLWLGLRKPTVEGRAVLVRLVPDATELRFDSVVWVDLDGKGIRELAWHAKTLWGIAGPMHDSKDGFFLWKLALDLPTTSGEVVQGNAIGEKLPPSSEGLIFEDSSAVILIDGGEGDDEDTCDTHSGQIRRSLN